MKKALIVLGVSAIAAVATKVVTSNVKKQKEEKGKFEFKGLFEKAAAKQAAKDSVKAVKGISHEVFSTIGMMALIEIFKSNKKAFTKIAIEMGIVSGALGIFRTSWDRKEYENAFDGKKRFIIPAMLIDTLIHAMHYFECSLTGAGIGWLIVCFKYKSFDSWITKTVLSTIIGFIIGNILTLFLPKAQEN